MKDNLTLQQDLSIKSIHEDDGKKGILTIKGSASVYRDDFGFFSIDRDSEIVNVHGVDLVSYRKNPILIYNHDFNKPIGKIISIDIVGDRLEVVAELHKMVGTEYIYEAAKKGIIKSFSVGIIPKSFLYHDINGEEVLEIVHSELVEISLAPVQSNRESLFDVVSEKSVTSGTGTPPTKGKTALADTLALQNGMSSDELKDYINQKALGMKDITTKEVELEEVKVEVVEEPKAEPVIKPVAEVDKPAVEPVVEPVTAPVVEEAKAEPKAFDEAALVSAIITAEETKAALLEKKAEDKIQADLQAEADAKSSKEARLKDAFAYIQETRDAIIGTPNDEFDADKIEAFYEAVSGAAEAIETKIGEIIIEATTPKEAE